MSDFENLDALLGSYPGNVNEEQENVSEIDTDLESRRHQHSTNLVGDNFRSLLTTNVSANSEITAETSRAFNSEIPPQMSRT